MILTHRRVFIRMVRVASERFGYLRRCLTLMVVGTSEALEHYQKSDGEEYASG